MSEGSRAGTSETFFARVGLNEVLVLDNFQDVPETTGFHALLLEALAQTP